MKADLVSIEAVQLLIVVEQDTGRVLQVSLDWLRLKIGKDSYLNIAFPLIGDDIGQVFIQGTKVTELYRWPIDRVLIEGRSVSCNNEGWSLGPAPAGPH